MNRDSESLLQQLMTTPVGRRWILKAGLGSAAAIAAATLSRSATTTAWAAGLNQSTTPAATATPTSNASAASQPSRTANRTLHFALAAAASGGVTNMKLVANDQRLPLVAHTTDSRTALKAQGGIFAAADLNTISHYVEDVPMPTDRAILVSVTGMRGTVDVLVSQTMNVPPATTLAMAQLAASSGNGLKSLAGSNARLAPLGLTASQVSTPQHAEQLESIVDMSQTAIAITMLHPNVATIDSTNAAATKAVLTPKPAVTNLASHLSQMHTQGKDWANLVTVKEPDGSDSQVVLTDPTTGTVTKATLQTVQLNPDGDKNFRTTVAAALTAGVKEVRNTGSLGTVIDTPLDQDTDASTRTWVQPQGTTPRAKPYTPPTPSPVALGSSASIDVSVKNTGYPSGIRTEIRSGYDNGSVQVRIYNNYVRWVWAYAQYMGKDKGDGNGGNMSVAPSANWPHTAYSRSLAIVPQVFTTLGVPIWDTNTVDVTLQFPQGAHSARMLFCGLGSDLRGGGWRQYFPTDAYPDKIAPTDEVLFAALVTGIFTIGLNVFALATDSSIAAAWGAIRKTFTGDGQATRAAIDAIRQLTSTASRFTAAETLALTVASGGETYLNIKNGGNDTNNVWTTLVGLGSVIPKILFGPAAESFYIQLAAEILAGWLANKIINAMPFIGEAIAVIEVVGDVATLAEVAAETIVSPWVIENEVNLTYQASVEISHDPVASGWPATASTWELSYLLDGQTSTDATTENMNVGGRTGSDPLNLTITAPFGSGTIQWSIVIKDQDGNQVGTGVSTSYVNDDPDNPPSSVSFAITEIPEPITANSVFKRADTVVYSDSAGGFTWSNAASDTAPADIATPSTSTAIQQVTGATVATTLGVVGVVWKQNDQYYLQGIPVDENGNTIALPPVSKGYARPPFLLFDSFVHRDNPTESNHVLLEPDDVTDAYFVRKVNLDPTTGAITWDSSKALGTFVLPVSAAALHSSGHVVAVHTDSGRVGFLKPVDTPLPSLAAYTGGAGSQTGLTQSPTAVAVTSGGIALVLESGAAQLAAFDLNGNPVQYFGADSTNLQFTQALANQGTYLDLAVDGASYIYLLYYTNDGSQPDDYHVDVYNPDGEPLITQNPGINISRLSVDFWRSIYGVNFTAMTAPGASVSVPSISRFDPHTPSTSTS
jgi:hypothetical protein